MLGSIVSTARTDGRTYEHGDIRGLRLPRSLSADERRMADKAATAVDEAFASAPLGARTYMVRSAIDSILCSEDAWYALAYRAMKNLHAATDAAERNRATARVNGIVIGMTHVCEVRHNLHRADRIAEFIDSSTRAPGMDALPGVFGVTFAFRIISKVYGRCDADATTA